MTTVTLRIKDDRKTDDVLRFLRDIDFLEVVQFGAAPDSSEYRCIDQLLASPLKLHGFEPMTREMAHER